MQEGKRRYQNLQDEKRKGNNLPGLMDAGLVSRKKQAQKALKYHA